MAVSSPIFGRFYKRFAAAMERRGADEHRRRLLAGLHGRVVEVGAGHGINFGYYPTTVTEVVAVEPEPRLRADAERAAADAPVPVVVTDGTAERLPLDDAALDAAVVSLVLCSVADPAVAAAELVRVLRPGGQLRFYEHVRADEPRRARIQDRFDVIWPYLGAGCHSGRDTLATLRAAGFEVDELERFRFPPGRVFIPTSPHALGRATPPGRARDTATAPPDDEEVP